MKVAIVQTQPVFGSVKSNILTVIELMESDPANLYILPELFNTGYNFLDADEVGLLAEPADGKTFRSMVEFARKKSCYVVYGFAEKSDRIYNASALIGPEGMLGIYRKIHLFYRENILFARGNKGFPVFDLPFGKVGMMICFDWIYPEAARTLALKGAQLIAHPSNLVLPYCPDAMVTRCLENKIFTATADRVGNENRGGFDLQFIGMSEVVSPRGEILIRLDKSEPGISVVEIDLSQADGKEINAYNDLLRDRIPGQYF
jgi:predicted amidohydrolase